MTEYTRDIKQLTQTASSTPQFAAPSNSLGGDIVNAVGTGLQFYQQRQAQKELGLAKEAMGFQNTRMAEGQEKLRQVNLLSQQGVTSTDIMRRTEALRKQYSPTEWWDILKETNKVSGVTSSEAMSSADMKEQKRISDRNELEESFSKYEPYMPDGVSINGSDEEIRQGLLFANATVARAEAEKAQIDLRGARLTVEGKEANIAKDKFLVDYVAITDNVFLKESKRLISSADFNNPQQLSDLTLQVSELKGQFVNQAVTAARSLGITLTSKQAEEQLSPQLKAFDLVTRELSRKDVKDIGANVMAAKVSNTVLLMQSAGTPAQKDLATLMVYGDLLPLDQLAGKVSSAYAGALTETATGKGVGNITDVFSMSPKTIEPQRELTPEETKAKNQEKKSRFELVVDIFKNAGDNVPQEVKDAYTTVVLEDLQGSNATQEDMLSGGGLVNYVKAISKGTPANLLSADRQDEVMLGIVNYAEKFLRRAVPQLLTEQTPSDSSLFTKPLPPKGFNVGLPTTALENKLNALDPETLKVTWNQKAVISNNVKAYNKFVDDLFISLDKLGATDDEIKYLKTEVSRAFVEANKG
jgi:hypothetical protein